MERKTVKGHVYGEVVISANDVSGVHISGLLKIPVQEREHRGNRYWTRK